MAALETIHRVTGFRARRTATGAEHGPTAIQWLVAGALIVAAAICLWRIPFIADAVLHTAVVVGFAVAAVSKLVLTLLGTEEAPAGAKKRFFHSDAAFARGKRAPPRLRRDRLPRYTILVPLYREAAVVEQLIAGLRALDYPRSRLQVLLIIEHEDRQTRDALAAIRLPAFMQVITNPPGGPRTKPNALNAALRQANGEFVVVYDAEDIPAPDQLVEAAARFAEDPALACLQAPLRIGNASQGFFARQFALEYAGQFEGVLPGLARLGAAFPLGGTSNHLRASVLRAQGGWDAFNVTEDADLGLRLGVHGHRIGMMTAPTREDAPTGFDDWLPQRTRWVKGYMQTWGVRMRRPFAGGLKGFVTLQATLGLAILGAALHAPMMMLLAAALVTDLFSWSAPLSLVSDLSVLSLGWAAAVTANMFGARRAGLRFRLTDALASLLYWPLQSFAFAFAVHQLVVAPHHWDKTNHIPSVDGAGPVPAPLDAMAAARVSPAA